MHRVWKILVGLSATVGICGSVVVALAAIEARQSTHQHIVITGNSMNPTISVGDVITIDPSLRPRVSDVITFVHDGRTVTHRIVDLWGSFDPSGAPRLLYKTHGDNNRTPDPWVVTDREVLGVQVTTPLITRIAHPISSRPLLLALLVLPLLLGLFMGEARTIADTIRALRHHTAGADLSVNK